MGAGSGEKGRGETNSCALRGEMGAGRREKKADTDD